MLITDLELLLEVKVFMFQSDRCGAEFCTPARLCTPSPPHQPLKPTHTRGGIIWQGAASAEERKGTHWLRLHRGESSIARYCSPQLRVLGFCIAWLVSWLVWVSAGKGTESVNVVGVGLESKSFEDDAVLQCNRDVRKTNRKHSDRDFSP